MQIMAVEFLNASLSLRHRMQYVGDLLASINQFFATVDLFGLFSLLHDFTTIAHAQHHGCNLSGGLLSLSGLQHTWVYNFSDKNCW
jgi:hypothetical protein